MKVIKYLRKKILIKSHVMKDNELRKLFINPYYIIIISFLLLSLLIKNSSIQLKKRKQEKIFIKNIETQKRKFPSLRKLDFQSDSLKICEKGSKNLSQYFETGDIQYVKLYENTSEEDPPNYILAFIDYLSDEGDSEQNFNTYMGHHLPVILFFTIAIAAIPCWIIWCGCCCYNCYCCFCCKKPNCRILFFILSTLMNLGVIIICILGLIKTDKIFIGLTNTECSILRFISEMLDGETKNELPKWGGVASILGMFNNTIYRIEQMSRDSIKDETEIKMNAYNSAKNSFINQLKTACNDINTETTYFYNNPSYILDIAKKFGKFENNKFIEETYADKWIKEADFSDSIEETYNTLGKIIVSNAAKRMEKAEEFIIYMKDGIEEIKDMIGEKILEISDEIDYYGRLFFKLIFGILLAFSIIFEILLILLFIFSCRKCIGSFCCLNLIIKILIHILWNIFAFFMIIIFLGGTLFMLIGSIGDDIFHLFSFIISEKNLESKNPKVLGKAGSFLNICMNGNGILTEKLGIDNDLGNIDLLKTLTNETDYVIDKIISNEEHTNEDFVYDELITEINVKINNKDFNFVGNNPSNEQQNLNLKENLSNLNQKLQACSIDERWSFSCYSEYPNLDNEPCSGSSIDNKCRDPMTCNSELTNDRYTTCSATNDPRQIVDSTITSIKYIENESNFNSIKKKGSEVKTAYRQFLTSAKNALAQYTIKIKPITAIYDNFVGNGSILGFINCEFLGKNVKVLLNYLDDSVGKEFRNFGLIIFSSGIMMALSISFTIILVIIFNETVKTREELINKYNFNKEIIQNKQPKEQLVTDNPQKFLNN